MVVLLAILSVLMVVLLTIFVGPDGSLIGHFCWSFL